MTDAGLCRACSIMLYDLTCVTPSQSSRTGCAQLLVIFLVEV